MHLKNCCRVSNTRNIIRLGVSDNTTQSSLTFFWESQLNEFSVGEKNYSYKWSRRTCKLSTNKQTSQLILSLGKRKTTLSRSRPCFRNSVSTLLQMYTQASYNTQ